MSTTRPKLLKAPELNPRPQPNFSGGQITLPGPQLVKKNEQQYRSSSRTPHTQSVILSKFPDLLHPRSLEAALMRAWYVKASGLQPAPCARAYQISAAAVSPFLAAASILGFQLCDTYTSSTRNTFRHEIWQRDGSFLLC